MAYTRLNVHLVFSTKNREPTINQEIDSRLYQYINGIAQNKGFKLLSGNGFTDHIHLLCGITPKIAVSDMVRTIKSNTSKWIHEDIGLRDFTWQSGYSAFSVSHSNIDDVSRYIQSQKDHHLKTSFKDEVLLLLKKHDINFDEKYLWG